MLRDSAHIQESDVKFVNKRRAREGKHLFEPLYSAADAEEAIKRFRGVGFRAPRNLFPGVSLTLLDAGHILGSSIIRLELSQGKRSTVFVFSGDLGRPGTPIIKDPEVPQGVETLVMESTYGSRCHEPIIDNRRTLQEIIERTVRRGGKVIIPCFAVGRTQEILYQLNALWEEGLLPRIPVYVDSPMAASATEIFKRHPECYDAAMISANRAATNGSALEFPGVVLTRSVDESKAIATRGGSSIIMSASGMCESGRILHHLANNLGDARNTVLFVGFQAEHTLGRKLLNGITPVNVFGEPVEVQAEVARIEGFSAHAGQDELLAWVDGVARGGALRRVALVHGEGDSLTVLREKIRERHSVEVIVPTRGEALDF
jgi:metallo-beta-lactamase family protein